MPAKLVPIEQAMDAIKKRSVHAFLAYSDSYLSKFTAKAMGNDILVVEDLAALGPAGLRKKLNTSESTIKRIRRVFRKSGIKF